MCVLSHRGRRPFAKDLAAPMRISSGCRKAQGEVASTKLDTVTHPCYDGILTAHTPAIDHGQDLGRGGRCGLGMKARVRKVNNLTTRRNGTTHSFRTDEARWRAEYQSASSDAYALRRRCGNKINIGAQKAEALPANDLMESGMVICAAPFGSIHRGCVRGHSGARIRAPRAQRCSALSIFVVHVCAACDRSRLLLLL